jgi:hypothetical protein
VAQSNALSEPAFCTRADKEDQMNKQKTSDAFTRDLNKRASEAPIKAAKAKQPNTERTRQSEFPVSRQGMHQESDHNKHNNPVQGAQKH